MHANSRGSRAARTKFERGCRRRCRLPARRTSRRTICGRRQFVRPARASCACSRRSSLARTAAGPIHRALQAAWAPRRPAVADVIRAALVLCADHELNVSAFTARCAASAGASPYDVVSAAMATLKGYKHGGAGERALSLVRHADTPRNARAAIVERLRQGERVPGFGHPLYPDGDPRAAVLLRLAESERKRRGLAAVSQSHPRRRRAAER